jgi:hypothetical protein
MRIPVRPFAVAATLVLIAACVEAADPGITGSTTTSQPTTTSTVPTTTTTTAGTTTTAPPTTTTTSVGGWSEIVTDPEIFGSAAVTDADRRDDVFVVTGCDPDAGGFPVWRATGGYDLARADGPPDIACVDEVEVVPFGWFARGEGALLVSDDGTGWTPLDLAAEFGYDYQGQLGFPAAIFASPDGERLIVLFSRASEAESTVATLAWTDDGASWTETALPAFDSSTISVVVPGGDGLLAAGASPGGEFVPTAAVFTSEDGLEWRRVTPSDSDYTDKTISDLRWANGMFVAVGGDVFKNGLMTAWTSTDGIAWTRSPHPDETTDPSVAQMTGLRVTAFDGSLWAAGMDFDARRPEPQSHPALWRSDDGVEWVRVDLDSLETPIPFEILSAPDVRIGVWPPPDVAIDDPPVLFRADPASW